MSFFKIKPVRSKKYLKWLSTLPCANCGAENDTIVPHHVIGVGNGIMGGKAGDDEAVPLCYICHADIHSAGSDKSQQWEWLARTLKEAIKEGIFKDIKL